MKKIILILLSLFSFNGYSQGEECAFSDNNFYFQVLLITNTVPGVDYDKDDFINHLETNSNISEADSQFLNAHIVEVYRQYPNHNEDPAQKFVYVVADDHTVRSLLSTYSESLNNPAFYCECEQSDGYFHYYVRLITDEIPLDGYDKDDFINHLDTTSNPSSSELDFLNDRVIEVYPGFLSSQTESLQRTVIVISDYDLIVPYLYGFTSSFDLLELICGEPILSVNDNLNVSDSIVVFPNPVVENSIISIENALQIKQLSIYNLEGKLLLEKEIKGIENIEMNQFNLNSGLYFLRFSSSGGNIITKKIIVK